MRAPAVMADEGGPCSNNGAGLRRGAAVNVVEAEGEVRKKMTPDFCGLVTMSSIETSKEVQGPSHSVADKWTHTDGTSQSLFDVAGTT